MKVICSVCGEVELHLLKDDYHCIYQGMGISQYVCLKCGKLPFEEVWKALEKGVNYIGNKKVEDVLG